MSDRITPGTYQVRADAEDFEWGVTEEKKTDFLRIKLVIEDEFENGAETDARLYFSDAAAKRSMEALKHLGWTGRDISNLPGLGSCLAEAVIEDEEYNGRTYTRVKWINAIGGGPSQINAMDEGHKRAFANRMRGHVAAVFGKDALKPAPAQQAEDDVPF